MIYFTTDKSSPVVEQRLVEILEANGFQRHITEELIQGPNMFVVTIEVKPLHER